MTVLYMKDISSIIVFVKQSFILVRDRWQQISGFFPLCKSFSPLGRFFSVESVGGRRTQWILNEIYPVSVAKPGSLIPGQPSGNLWNVRLLFHYFSSGLRYFSAVRLLARMREKTR